MKQLVDVLILALSVFLLAGCLNSRSPSMATLYRDYQAGQDIKNEKHEEALAKYYLLLEEDVERGATHSNIGVLLNAVQKPEEALKSLLHALKLAEISKDQETIFKILYNLGVYYGALKKVPEALNYYQMALEITPDSHEIKTNIELLMQQQKQDQKQQQNKSNEQNKEKNKEKSNEKSNEQNKEQNKESDEKNPQSSDESESEKDQNKDQEKKEDKKEDQKKLNSPKYQPRPFKGDELSEIDVKKILGELKNQEQKIRANFDKKEKKGKFKNNEKDW